MLVPPKFSEKTKESKLLVRSFRHIYKVAGLGIATGISGLLSLSTLQQDKPISIDNTVPSRESFSIEESTKEFERVESIAVDESAGNIATSTPTAESQNFVDSNLDIVTITTDADANALTGYDLFIPFVIITVILGGLTVYYLWKSLKKLKQLK